MTQRQFDVENEKDMADLWDILPNSINKIKKSNYPDTLDTLYFQNGPQLSSIIKINWHDKTEITRPIQEATEADIGKLCKFWDFDDGERKYGILRDISSIDKYQMYSRDDYFNHASRLTKQEIEELI